MPALAAPAGGRAAGACGRAQRQGSGRGRGSAGAQGQVTVPFSAAAPFWLPGPLAPSSHVCSAARSPLQADGLLPTARQSLGRLESALRTQNCQQWRPAAYGPRPGRGCMLGWSDRSLSPSQPRATARPKTPQPACPSIRSIPVQTGAALPPNLCCPRCPRCARCRRR